MIKGIALDAFDTTLEITDRRNPYGRLFELLKVDKREARLMALTANLSFEQLAYRLSPHGGEGEHLQVLQLCEDLEAELRSVKLFPETPGVLHELKRKGLKLAVISNLAKPYGAPVRRLFEMLVHQFVFSFELGMFKPQKQIFHALAETLQLQPWEILVVGNSKTQDFDGAQAPEVGMPALHLDRSGRSHSHPTIRTLVGVLEYLQR